MNSWLILTIKLNASINLEKYIKSPNIRNQKWKKKQETNRIDKIHSVSKQMRFNYHHETSLLITSILIYHLMYMYSVNHFF